MPVVLVPAASAASGLARTCAKFLQEEGLCPEETCLLQCVVTSAQEPCALRCSPKDCLDIPAESCPSDTCLTLMGCQDEPVCYYLSSVEEPVCGDAGYSGPAECCEGLSKRCGVEFLDGSCDMIGVNSVYAVPICLPCGNGICNQFEDRCNCPEDCGT